MSTPEQDAALAADKEVTRTFEIWQAIKKKNKGKWTDELDEAEGDYVNATVQAHRAWKKVGPDPILSQLAEAQRLTDIAEGHEVE